jgi:hypothetical protein
MAKFVLQNVRLFAGGADLTTVNNKAEITAEVEEKEATAFAPSGPLWREVLGGIRSTSIDASGQWEAGDLSKVDNSMWAQSGSRDAWTVCPEGAAFGSLAWFTAAMRQSYNLGGAVGDVAPWTAKGSGGWPLVRGNIDVSPGSPISASPSFAPPIEIVGGVPEGQSLYAALHVFSVSGTTPELTTVINSDDNTDFSSPDQRLAFDPQTTVGSQIIRVAGPITDTYFAAASTLTGTDPSFLVAIAIGVG